MTRTIIATLTALAITTAPAFACSEADVLARQDTLVAAIQALVATDPAKAQAIVAQMQTQMDAAAASGDEAAVCIIIDTAIAQATG